jgi:hypothetical protein
LSPEGELGEVGLEVELFRNKICEEGDSSKSTTNGMAEARTTEEKKEVKVEHRSAANTVDSSEAMKLFAVTPEGGPGSPFSIFSLNTHQSRT